MEAVSERLNRHGFRLSVVAVLVALVSFVLVHDLDLAVPAMATVSTDMSVAHTANAHSSAALCAVALIVEFSLLGLMTVQRRRISPQLTTPSTSPTPTSRSRYLSGRLLYELCVIRT